MILEIIVAVVLIIAILLFVGMPVASILNLLVMLLCGVLLLMVAFVVLFFLLTDLSLLFYRRVEGQFLRFDDSSRFDRAVYAVGDKEYTCVFPAESVARRQIYKEAHCTLLIPRSGRQNRAYDRHSLLIITLGSIFAAVLAALSIFALFWVFRT